MVFHNLDMTLDNVWQFYVNNGSESDHLVYHPSVVTEILESNKMFNNRKFSHSSNKLYEKSRYDNKGHTTSFKDKQQHVCYKSSKFFCIKCAITLHPKECFKMYHSAHL